MENTFEDFFEAKNDPIVDDVEVETETVETTETPEVEEVETVEDAVEPEITEPVVEETVAKPDDRADATKWVPVAAMTAERTKAKTFQDRVAALETELAQYRPQPNQATQAQPQNFQAQGIPDPFDDPQGFHNYTLQQATQIARQEMQLSNFNQSRARASAKYGEEYLAEVADWAGTLPAGFEAQVLSQPDPVEWAIAERKRIELINSFQADPDAYVRARAAELGLAATPTMEAPQIQPVAKDTGPKSLINAKSANSNIDPKAKAKDDFAAFFKQ